MVPHHSPVNKLRNAILRNEKLIGRGKDLEILVMTHTVTES